MTPQTKSSAPAKAASARPIANEAEARVLELRAEADAVSDRTCKAALLYEAAFLSETALRQPAQAVNDYLAAYNFDNRFRLPLYALIRMFERRRSFKNLTRLYETELRSARDPGESATALVDHAALAVLNGSEPEATRTRLERALEHDGAFEATLLLEWNRRSSGDRDGALRALLRRAQDCDDPIHRGVILLEAAAYHEQKGELSAALEALKTAALGATKHDTFLAALARFAREHGFVSELVEASERRAELAAAELREREAGAEPDQSLVELLRARAVALWYEAARLRCTNLSDPEGALSCISNALEIRPDDLLLRQTRMLAYDLMEDRGRAAEEARALLAQGVEGEHAAALHFRLAEHALVSGQSEAAREGLMEAIAQAGGSIAADAILDDLLLDEEQHRDRIERREARAAAADSARASRWLLEAAQIAADELKDVNKALELFRRADTKAPGLQEVAREAYGAALELGDAALARFGIERLLARDLEEDERAALIHHQLELAESEDDERALIDAHLGAEGTRGFLPHIARVRAAQSRDMALLSRTHELLAERALNPALALSHLCAAARAHVRAGNAPRARAVLEQVLSRAPAHPYALTLLQEVLRQQGETQEVIGLWRKAAEAQGDARRAEMSLLLAGAAAEAAADPARAAQSYEQAADRNPASVGPLWALLRLGQRLNDGALELRAREALAAREVAEQRPGIESLLVAEHYELVNDKPELAEAGLERTLVDGQVGHHAALQLAVSPSAPAELRETALETLAARSDAALQPKLLRELGGILVAQGAEHARVLDVVERVIEQDRHEPWALWTRTTIPLPHDEEGHANALDALAAQTSDPRVAANLRGEALWVRRLARPDADLAEALPPLPEGALAPELARELVELVSPGRDAALRLRAVEGVAGALDDERSTAFLEVARARLAVGDAIGALASLDKVLEADPADLTALELVRVAARKAERFARAAGAAETLAGYLEGELALQLLEESAVLRMDELSDVTGAERLLRRILEAAPGRPIAYARLHDLLTQRGDTAALIGLVRDRTEQVDEAEDLVRLFYELARLCRAAGDLDGALDALDNVLMLEEHVGALALAAEIHTSRENWSGAVEALEALAQASFVPQAQRRLARLGAADFLEHRLKDGPGALRQLDRLIEEGHADVALHVRMADVAERTSDVHQAVRSLKAAIELAQGDARVDLSLRCAKLIVDKQQDKAAGAALYQVVVAARPTHVAATRALFELAGDDAARSQVLGRFEDAVRRELAADPLAPESLRKLLALGELRGDADVGFVALSTLVAIDAATHGERDAADAAMRKQVGARVAAGAALKPEELASLLAPEIAAPYRNLLHAVFSAAAEIDQLEPGRFGVGRSQRVAPREVNQVRDEVAAMAGALGLRLGDFYVGGEQAGQAAALPREEELAFVVGIGVTSPLSPTRRQQIALQLAAAQLAALPILSRTPAQSARLLFAALAACECPLPSTIGREELGELPRTLSRALPRKAKKSLPDVARSLPDAGADAERQCLLALRHTRRLALLLAGDLPSSLEGVLGAMPSPDAIAGSEEALDLVRAWTSGAMAGLRKKLGLAR